MVWSRNSKLIAGVVALVLLVGLVGTFFWKAQRPRREATGGRQTASGQADVTSLRRLSVADDLSAEEQARLDRAGNNPGDVRRALLEIHELRLAYARRDLQAAQAQRARLQDLGASRMSPERARAVREREQVAAVKVANYANAVSALQSWVPGRTSQNAAVETRSESPSAQPVSDAQPGGQAAGNAAAGTSGAQTGDLSAEELPAPPETEVSEAAKHPTVTVYADGAGRAVSEPTPEVALASGPEKERDQAEIMATLQRWAHAMVLNDPRAETAEYSPHMDRYFLYRNVDRSFVEADKAAYLRRGNITANFSVENVHFENETADSADVSLVKDVAWERSRDGSTHKLIRSRLHMVKTSQGWKIGGEQDFR